jgi:hypothetical protein
MKKNMVTNHQGSVAIMLILVIVLLSTITTAAVALAISTTRDTTTQTLGERALAVAESGAENAILRLLRDPSYAGESNLPIGPGTATIAVTGSSPKVITEYGHRGRVRALVSHAQRHRQLLTVSSWREL